MKFPNPFRWLATDDPAPQDFHRWELSEHPDATTEGGAWWCSYGTRHAINEHCNCASPAAVLAGAFPDHDWVVPDDDIEAELDYLALFDGIGGAAMIAHSSKVARHFAERTAA